jgi:hypothetical protein
MNFLHPRLQRALKMNLSKTLFFASLFTFSSFTQAATVDFTPSADGDITTWGGDNVDTIDTVITVVESGRNITNGILEFDLSSISDTAIINSASLSVTLTRFISNVPSQPTAKIDIFAFNGDGTVNISDYSASGTKVVDTTTPKGGVAGDKLTFDFENLTPINTALAGDLLTLRFETDNYASIAFATSENTNYAAAILSVDYTDVSAVPVPAAALLFAPAMLGFVALRKSSRKA